MKLHAKRHFLRFFGGAILAISAPDMVVRADGDQFFEPQEIPGQPVFVLFGSVKDDHGKYLVNAAVTVNVLEPILIYDTRTNLLGRFRTVDIGRAVAELGYDVDPTRIEISISAPGYVLLRRLNRYSPRRQNGALEIDFVMTKKK